MILGTKYTSALLSNTQLLETGRYQRFRKRNRFSRNLALPPVITLELNKKGQPKGSITQKVRRREEEVLFIQRQKWQVKAM